MLIGITGSSGAGKGLVVRCFAEHGFGVIDADRIAREAVEPGQPALRRLTETFGETILFPDGTLNRRELARRAFSSRQNTDRLNAVLHPDIARRMIRLAREFRAKGVHCVFDAPQLFEAGLEKICDCCVAVTAPEDLRVARLLARDGVSEEEIRSRIKMQYDDAFFKKRCRYIIVNDADISTLTKRTETIIEELLKTGA